MEQAPPQTAAPSHEPRRHFGTFQGVFTPTLLTILGVILFLRLGWVVGNAGVLGAVLIVCLSLAISTATGLSLSSIASNTRLEAGGPYSIVSNALGFEIGGSVGIPLYLSQAFAVAMYVFGFREGWLWAFPTHDPLLVDLGVFGVIFVLAFISASLAFRVQYVVMAVLGASLLSVLISPSLWSVQGDVRPWGGFESVGTAGTTGFWAVFAVFFPAVTGITAGANMSGELKSPRRSIPLGTLSAIAVSGAIYLAFTLLLGVSGQAQTLREDYTVLFDISLWSPLVLAGLLAATFSSALSSLVGAPRILAALGRDDVVPGGSWLAGLDARGEPRHALLVTGALVLSALMLRELNVVAPLITMFFLITYAVLNLVLLFESSLRLTSFRPSLRLPIIVPLAGAVGCVFTMFVVNATVSLLASAGVVSIYALLMRKRFPRHDDVRSGIFGAFSEWAATHVAELGERHPRAWKPRLLVPTRDDATVRGYFRLLMHLAAPDGSVRLLKLYEPGEDPRPTEDRLRALTEHGAEGVAMTCGSYQSSSLTGLASAARAFASSVWSPNTLLLSLPREDETAEEVFAAIEEGKRERIGTVLISFIDQGTTGQERSINLWIPPPAEPTKVEAHLDATRLHLAVLLAYRLEEAWGGNLNLVSVVENEAEAEAAEQFLKQVLDATRLPLGTRVVVGKGELRDYLGEAPLADLDIFGVPREPTRAWLAQMTAATRSSCLFVVDSGDESAVV